VLDLAAQVRDVRVARALVADMAGVPEVGEDLAPAEGAPGVPGEERE
jgi:hypothetical protein